MSTPAKLTAVSPLSFRDEYLVEKLRELLARAEQGDIRAVAVAYEAKNGDAGHWAAFGRMTNRTQMVGKLAVLQQHIVLNECLEWKPGGG
jgi:hypothetical protein